MKKSSFGVLAVAGALLPLLATAADTGLLTERVLPLRLSLEAAQAAIEACAAGGFHVSVVITDQYGNTKLELVSDGTVYTTLDSARRKAYTAAMMRQPTAAFQQFIAANPTAPLIGAAVR